MPIQSESHIFSGFSGEIRTQLITKENFTDKLAVVLPGAGYSYREPLLRYSIQILLKNNYQVLAWDKVYGDDPKWRSLTSEVEARKIVEEDHVQVFEQIKKKFSQPLDLILGRSLGTYAMACLLDRGIIAPKKIIWQTPALGNKWNTMRDCPIPGFGIIGTADHYFRQVIENLPKDRIVIDDADHAMEIPNEPIRSIEIMKQVMMATEEWVRKD